MKRLTRSSNASKHEMKTRLVVGIAKLIKAKGMTQSAAADLIGIQRPDISKILRGNLPVSLERLLNIAQALGSDVEIKVKYSRRNRRGRISLVMD